LAAHRQSVGDIALASRIGGCEFFHCFIVSFARFSVPAEPGFLFPGAGIKYFS
jgi:hypothetical protein